MTRLPILAAIPTRERPRTLKTLAIQAARAGRWGGFLLMTFAWPASLLAGVFVGTAAQMVLTRPAGQIAGAGIVGLVMGAAQRRTLGGAATSSLIPASLFGAIAGWMLGLAAVWALGRFTTLPPWAGAWVRVAVVGLCAGSFQSLTLVTSRKERVLWALLSMVAWGLTLGPWLLPRAPLALRVAALLVPGIFGAISITFPRVRVRPRAAARGTWAWTERAVRPDDVSVVL